MHILQPPEAFSDRIDGRGAVFGTGLLLGLAFLPFPFALCGPVALIPLILRWGRLGSWREALLTAYGAHLVAFGIAFSWPLLHVFSETAWLSLPPLLLLPLWLALPYAAALPIRDRLGHAAGLAALGASVLLSEWLLSHGPLAFPWTLLGHTQSAVYPVNHLAAVAGVPGLTAWVFALNAVLSVLVSGRASRPVFAGAAAVLLVLLGCTAAGLRPEATPSGPPLTVLAVQPAIPAEAWPSGPIDGRADRLLALSERAMAEGARPDLVAWPETALPAAASPAAARAVYDRLQRWVDARGVALLTGAVLPIPESAGAGVGYQNAALLLTAGSARQVRAKARLVPFAEQVPYADRWPWLRRFAVPSGGVAGYEAGTGEAPLLLAGRRLGVYICFESTFGDQLRGPAARSDLLVVLTHDGWWGPSLGRHQHLLIDRLRAIEANRPLLRVSAAGPTTLVHADGAVEEPTRWMERSARIFSITPASGTTFYGRHGDWITPFALTLLVVLAAMAWLARRPTHPRRPAYALP